MVLNCYWKTKNFREEFKANRTVEKVNLRQYFRKTGINKDSIHRILQGNKW